ncbi:unnamed protein product [Rhizophagus irregularis]|nr:unnamed protein product [Rhizophagus irregularis]CAB5348849.1 unnamed protein product [Rhizophagus irregularis]
MSLEFPEKQKTYYFNKLYPNILTYDDASWPIRAGKFKTITHKLNYYNLEYSIYRAFIKGQPTNQKCIRGFCYNPAGYYTHYDLKLAMKLDLHIELSSESPNALIFEQVYLMSGYNIFYQWASYKDQGRGWTSRKSGQANASITLGSCKAYSHRWIYYYWIKYRTADRKM